MTEFDDPTHEHVDEDEKADVEGQTGGLYGGAEDFARDEPAPPEEATHGESPAREEE